MCHVHVECEKTPETRPLRYIASVVMCSMEPNKFSKVRVLTTFSLVRVKFSSLSLATSDDTESRECNKEPSERTLSHSTIDLLKEAQIIAMDSILGFYSPVYP